MVELLSSDEDEAPAEEPGDEEEEDEEEEEEQDEAEYSKVRRAAIYCVFQKRPPIAQEAQSTCRDPGLCCGMAIPYWTDSDQAIMQKQTRFGFHNSS